MEQSVSRGPIMSVAPTVASILRDHVTLSIEGIDRMYLNVYQPKLQREGGVAAYLICHLGHRMASTMSLNPITQKFVSGIEAFAKSQRVDLITFAKGDRKDDVAACYRARSKGAEGILFIGKAQEKARVPRTVTRRSASGGSYPWLVSSTAMVNHYYFYGIDDDFGPFFLKFCSYFPYGAKLCINGHEFLKRQLEKRGIAFEGLDNGLLSCADPKAAQKICDEFSGPTIDAMLRKWLRILPHPFSARDRRAGYRYDLSMLQTEMSLTQVLDTPVAGRLLFEQMIRENLDLGRPDRVQLIFDRKIVKRTPGRFRTRVITRGVIPSIHVDYKTSKIKQYHKEGRALRTETTINNPKDFDLGKRIKNLPALRKIGFQANRRLLEIERLSHDAILGEEEFQSVVRPTDVHSQHASALRFCDSRVQALLSGIVLFAHNLRGFANRDLRESQENLLGNPNASITPGRMSYDLRRLRLHGLIERIPKTHRYRLTPKGNRIALVFSRTYHRVLRPAIATARDPRQNATPLGRAFRNLDVQLDAAIQSLLAA